MKRVILIGAALVVVLIAVGVFVLYSSLDEVVRTAVERIGSDATGTEVTLDEVEISPTSGSGALRRFRMTNPEGFAEGDAFKFDEVMVTVDASTLTSDPVVITEVVIDGPEVTYALGQGGSNVERIKRNADAYAADEGGSGGGGGESGPNLVIEKLVMRNGTVKVTAPGISDKELKTSLPEVTLRDIGKDGTGATPGEVMSQTIGAIAAAATRAAQSVDLQALGAGAKALADDARKALEGSGEGLGGVTEEAEERLQQLME